MYIELQTTNGELGMFILIILGTGLFCFVSYNLIQKYLATG